MTLAEVGESRSTRNFLGLSTPKSGRKIGCVLTGPPTGFFHAILRASQFVELYDEELGAEPFRRGIVTEKHPAGRVGGRIRALSRLGTFPVMAGYSLTRVFRSAPAGVGITFLSPEVFRGRRFAPATWEKESSGSRPGTPQMIVIDPHVLAPALFPAPGNIEPGGLQWYDLTALLGHIFCRGRPAGAALLPRPLPPADPAAAFVLARITAKIMAFALTPRRVGI